MPYCEMPLAVFLPSFTSRPTTTPGVRLTDIIQPVVSTDYSGYSRCRLVPRSVQEGLQVFKGLAG